MTNAEIMFSLQTALGYSNVCHARDAAVSISDLSCYLHTSGPVEALLIDIVNELGRFIWGLWQFMTDADTIDEPTVMDIRF